MYLSSISTHFDHETRLIDSDVSFHITPHREWFCDNEKYTGGYVFSGDDSIVKLIGLGRV